MRWGGGRSCAASGSPGRRRPGSPRGCAVDPARPVGTRLAAGACLGLGCAAAMLPAGSPQPGNTLAWASGPGPVGAARFSRGLPRETPALFPAKLFRNCTGSGRLCAFVPAQPPLVRSARSPSQCPGAGLDRLLETARSPWGQSPKGLSLCCPTQLQVIPASGSPRPPAILRSCPCTHAHPHSGRLAEPHPAAGALRGEAAGPRCVYLLRFRRLQGSLLAS